MEREGGVDRERGEGRRCKVEEGAGRRTSEEESVRANEGTIQSDLFSEKSLEWLMLINILVIWSCFAQRTFFCLT